MKSSSSFNEEKNVRGGQRQECSRGSAARCLLSAVAALLAVFTFQTKTYSLIIRQEKYVPDARGWTFLASLGQPIPSAFAYTTELRTIDQKELENIANNTEKIAMSPGVYAELTNRIRGLKHARKPLRIMVNAHPCAGKSTFLELSRGRPPRHPPELLGCRLIDYDWLAPVLRDSSYLMQNTTTGSLAVTNRTALLGDSIRSSKKQKFEDVIYIYVIPPLTAIVKYIERRHKIDGRGKWSDFGRVIERRRASLLQIINDGLLVEPLFPSFQEGLEFCINTYDLDSRVDAPNRGGGVVKIEPFG